MVRWDLSFFFPFFFLKAGKMKTNFDLMTRERGQRRRKRLPTIEKVKISSWSSNELHDVGRVRDISTGSLFHWFISFNYTTAVDAL